MDLSTALTISLFFYGIFLVLLGIEYFTDKRRKERVQIPPQKTPSRMEKPQRIKKEGSEQLEDLEKTAEREEPTGAPKIWTEEEFE